ncbi:hypothetical protein [Parvularcula marina]|uniref:Uncharacterized protein n=1 Tax=Parvularcula marina TaxID=2292771 RepID=A0A371RF35_9PROT|nr:hypothetical protein [Parvularcula marina]RFB04054.1 hypothetical protein DX908_01395 [Parvularcula marina]
MLELNSHRWSKLSHAYGTASDIPGLLAALEKCPPAEDEESEPYFTLWSSLCHQGDIYTASYAALPHLIRVCLEQPARTHWSVLQLAVCIEIARLSNRGPDMPKDLGAAYKAALGHFPETVLHLTKNQKSPDLAAISASATALSQGELVLAEAILEMDRETASAFLRWFRAQ